MIPEKVINDIRDRSDIVEVIGSMLDLKRSGRNFKALCPFHGEKTPSFMISPEKQIYHCFGCGKGGNVFNFIMEHEGVTFIEAVRKLAGELGIDVGKYIEGTGESRKLDPYYGAMEFAADFYSRSLSESKEGAAARKYIEGRKLGSDALQQFRLGYAPPAWDSLYRAASVAGISREILLELKLVMRSRGGSGYRDYFRNRIIFPIFSISNRIVAFAGRVLDNSEPKYLNSTESQIYSKSRILYGLNASRDEIRKSKKAVIVEGYIDYLMLWMNGIRNISAVCGTSLTEEQSRLLARYAKHVYIINDGDRAGVRAAVRAADQLLVEGFEIQIVILPEDEDPDSFVRKNGADALTEMMRSAPAYFSYMKAESYRGTRTTQRKSQVINHLLESVSRVRDAVRRDLLLQEIAGLFDVPVDLLRKGVKPEKAKLARAQSVERSRPSKREQIQKELFRFGLEGGHFARSIMENLMEEDFEGELFRKYYKALDLALKNDIDIQSPDFTGAISDVELSKLASEIALMDVPPGPADQVFEDTIVWLKKAALRDEMTDMKKRIGELETLGKDGDALEELEIAEAYRKIAREYKKLGLKEDGQSNGSQENR